MFESDKEVNGNPVDDMATVSTFTTLGNTTWGNKTRENDDGTNKSLRQKSAVGGKGNYGTGSVISVAVMIIFLGVAAAGLLTYFGMRAEWKGRAEDFERGAFITVSKIQDSFEEYVNVASLVHGRFRERPQFNQTALEKDPKTYNDEYMAWSEDFRQKFREFYEYISASGLKFKAIQFDPMITLQERSIAETEAFAYYNQNYPEVNYTGFRGLYGDSNLLEPSPWDRSHYFPIHYMEPIPGNEAAIDVDYYSSEPTIQAVNTMFETKSPSLTDRLMDGRCFTGEGEFSVDHGPSFEIVLMHPGFKVSSDDESSWPRDFSSIALCMEDLMKRSSDHQNRCITYYIHDLSNNSYSNEPVFMGAVSLDHEVGEGKEDSNSMTFLDEIPFDELDCSNKNTCYQKVIDIANRNWIITILDHHPADKSRLLYIALIGLIVLSGFVCVALWVLSTDRKNRNYSMLKAEAAADRNALVLENANRAAKKERELNDFLAHEVRNPLSAAMAATQFLRTELDRKRKGSRDVHSHFYDSDDEKDDHGDAIDEGNDMEIVSPRLEQAREDVRVVDHALRFINELLRNMLDMHRASSGKLQVKMAPVDVLHDILEPVAGMLHRGEGRIGREGQGDEKVKVIVDCPEDIVVQSDVLRLKQVILNLGRNSVKFINKGFICLRAEIVDVDNYDDLSNDIELGDSDLDSDLELESTNACQTVRIYVEDSGSGIPEEKREKLFAKYQESLDLLSQGTGIGLHLCKNLVDLMGGNICLDNDYESGIPDNPGCRFIVDLQSAPLDTAVLGLPSIEGTNNAASHVNFSTDCSFKNSSKLGKTASTEGLEGSEFDSDNTLGVELPKNLNVLFVDDDRVLRKLFGRTIKMVAPEWNIREAANGETAILLAQEEAFDLIFCDMYMASVEKQLLGTETVAELRSNGVKCRICGLSANDKEMEFLEAGANSFLFKPIPCEAKMLRQTLHQVLYGEDWKHH